MLVTPATGESFIQEESRAANRASLLATAARPTSRSLVHGLLTICLVIWLAGSGWMVLLHGLRLGKVRKLMQTTTPPGAELQTKVSQVAARLQISAPKIVHMPSLSSPFVWGLGHPVLAWPQGEPADQTVITHELAHLRRRDHWVAHIELAGIVLLWWHPLFWLIRNRIRYYAELSCDAWAVWAFPTQRRAYAAALIDAIERLSVPVSTPALHAATDTGRRHFEKRLDLIMKQGTLRYLPRHGWWAALAMPLLLLPAWTSENGQPIAVPTIPKLDAEIEKVLRPSAHLNHANRYLQTDTFELAAVALAEVVDSPVAQGRHYSDLGKALLEIGRYGEAAEAFKHQAQKTYKAGEARFHAALALAHAGSHRQAAEQLDLAIRYGFLNCNSLAKHRYILMDLANYDDIIASCEQGKDYALALEAYIMSERWQRAIKTCNDLLQVTPDYGFAYQRLGYALARTEDYGKATTAFFRQAQLGFQPETAYYNLACVFSQQGNGGMAVDFLRRAAYSGFTDHRRITEDPALAPAREEKDFESVLALYNSHRLKEWAGGQMDCGESATLVEKLWVPAMDEPAIQPDWVLHLLGLSMLAEDQPEAAIGVFRLHILAGHQRDLNASLYHTARAQARLGQTDAAWASLYRAVEMGFNQVNTIRGEPDFKSMRCDSRFEEIMSYAIDQNFLTLFGAVDWGHLRDHARSRLTSNPGDGTAMHQLGIALLRLEAHEEAAEAFRSQIHAGYNVLTASYNIACCYAIKGDKQRALTWLEKAVEAGWNNWNTMRNDPDLKSLRKDPRFIALVSNGKYACNSSGLGK